MAKDGELRGEFLLNKAEQAAVLLERGLVDGRSAWRYGCRIRQGLDPGGNCEDK